MIQIIVRRPGQEHPRGARPPQGLQPAPGRPGQACRQLTIAI